LSKAYTVKLIENPLSPALPPMAMCPCLSAPVSGFGAGASEPQRIASAYGEAVERDAIWTAREDFVGPCAKGYILPMGMDCRPAGSEEVEWAYYQSTQGGRFAVHRPTRGSARPAFHMPVSIGSAVHSTPALAMANALNELRERAVMQDVLDGKRQLAAAAAPDALTPLVALLRKAGWDMHFWHARVGELSFALVLAMAMQASPVPVQATVAGAKVRASGSAAAAGAMYEALQLIEYLYLAPSLAQLPPGLVYYLSGPGRHILQAHIQAATVPELSACSSHDPLAETLVLHRAWTCDDLSFVETIAPTLPIASHFQSATGRHPYPI
jgi:hypothetical protein